MSSEARAMELLCAIGDIDDKFIEEAMPKEFKADEGGSCGSGCSGAPAIVKLKRMLPLLLAAALAASLPLAAWGGSKIFDAVQEKTQEANLAPQEVAQLSDELAEQGLTAEELENVEPLRRNGNGQTYGVAPLGADLVLVIDDDGNKGYVYRYWLEYEDMQTEEDAKRISREKERVLVVYESDGKTPTGGTFTMK